MKKIKVLILMKIIFVLQIIAIASISVAQDLQQGNDAALKEPKKQTLSFEDELIEGGAQKPELFYLLQQKNFNYKRLIKLRENFLPEMRKTAEDIQRIRGGR
jgi:hypothetical protein